MSGSEGSSGKGDLDILWQRKARLNESKRKACGQKPGRRNDGNDQAPVARLRPIGSTPLNLLLNTIEDAPPEIRQRRPSCSCQESILQRISLGELRAQREREIKVGVPGRNIGLKPDAGKGFIGPALQDHRTAALVGCGLALI